MKIRSSLAAIFAVFSVMLVLAPSAHAEEKKSTKKDEKPVPVMVEIQPGDSLSSIADANNTTYVRIFDANDFITNPDLINAGDQVRIPTADEQLPDRYGDMYSAPVVTTQANASASTNTSVRRSAATVSRASSAGNSYYYGYCTWYAKQRRPDLPNRLGNGGQWVMNAAAQGYATGTTPRAGAIAEMPGHVAYVESVNGDGTLVISEMNGPAGFGVVGTRTVPASTYFGYIY